MGCWSSLAATTAPTPTGLTRTGEELHYEDLVRAELEKNVDNAACGGTHLLFGLTWAYHLHLKEGGKTDGVWKEIADRIAEYKKRARELAER